MLQYYQVHLLFTLPLTIIVYLIHRPLISAFDRLKLVVLCAFGIVFRLSFENYAAYKQVSYAWTSNAIESCFVISIQTIFAAISTSLLTRWTPHAKFLKSTNPSNRWYLVVAMAVLTMLGWAIATSGTATHYVGSLLLWSLPLLMYVWYKSGAFIVNRRTEFGISLATTSFYLCCIDSIANPGVGWTMTAVVEKCLLIFVSNLMIVVLSFGLDRANAIVFTHKQKPLMFQKPKKDLSCFRKEIKTFFIAFVTDDSQLDQERLNDIKVCFNYLEKETTSFFLTMNLCPRGKSKHKNLFYRNTK